jgi:hypothetical protein
MDIGYFRIDREQDSLFNFLKHGKINKITFKRKNFKLVSRSFLKFLFFKSTMK